MKRDRSLLEQVVLRLLLLAIAVVVSVRITPQLPTHAPTPVVCAVDQRSSGDTFKVGERSEPRVSPASPLDRLPSVPPCWSFGVAGVPREAVVLSVLATCSRSDGDPRPVVKHVPRMERGDPPSI